MKRFVKRNAPKLLRRPQLQEEPIAHFRLCHHCLFLNESNEEVVKCDRCGRYLASDSLFIRGGDERTGFGFDVKDEFDDEDGRKTEGQSSVPRKNPTRLTGLSVVW